MPKPAPPAGMPLDGLAEYIRQQVSNALRRARGDMSVPELPDPSVTFVDLPAQAASIGIFARSCVECRALVLRADESAHANWHRQLLRTVVDTPVLDAEPGSQWVPRSAIDVPVQPDPPTTGGD